MHLYAIFAACTACNCTELVVTSVQDTVLDFSGYAVHARHSYLWVVEVNRWHHTVCASLCELSCYPSFQENRGVNRCSPDIHMYISVCCYVAHDSKKIGVWTHTPTSQCELSCYPSFQEKRGVNQYSPDMHNYISL